MTPSVRRAARRAFPGRPRGDAGAIAVMVAILALVLLGAGAVAVDMGQVYAKRAALQSKVDLAVLAAAAELDGGASCSAAAMNAARQHLAPTGSSGDGALYASSQVSLNEVSVPTLDAQAIRDRRAAGDQGAFIDCDEWQVRLWAPTAHVNFGLARAFAGAATGTDVPAAAEAGVYSPLSATFPAFAVSGCDYGEETLLDPPIGADGPYVPDLPEDNPPFEDARLDQLLPTNEIDLNQVMNLEIDGLRFANPAAVTWVAFSTESGQHLQYPVGGTNPNVTIVNNTRIRISPIPATVRSTEEMWWVRVSKQVTTDPTRWTNPDGEALPLRVGDPLLECDGAGNEGNFGTVDLPSLQPPASAENAIEWNILTDVDYGLTTLSPGGTCSPGSGGAVAPTAEGTNCVLAQPGFPGNPATGGLITGRGGTPGRLAAKDTTPGCGPGGSSGEYQTPPIQGRRYWINDDTLNCFLRDGATLGTITSPGYSGPGVVSTDVFDSPRFFWIPVFSIEPSQGGSSHYAIVDFRPAFITSANTADVHNGLGISPNGIETLKVTFFNTNALPESTSGPTMTYLGVGPKIIVLVD